MSVSLYCPLVILTSLSFECTLISFFLENEVLGNFKQECGKLKFFAWEMYLCFYLWGEINAFNQVLCLAQWALSKAPWSGDIISSGWDLTFIFSSTRTCLVTLNKLLNLTLTYFYYLQIGYNRFSLPHDGTEGQLT